jgi:hypothetical protein
MYTDQNSHVLGISLLVNFWELHRWINYLYFYDKFFYQKVHLPWGSLLLPAVKEKMEPQTEMRPRDLICEITASLSVPPT